MGMTLGLENPPNTRWIGFKRTPRAIYSYVAKKYHPNKTNKQTNHLNEPAHKA
jgi:hypothetical protein